MKEGLRVLRGRPTRGQQNTLRLRLMFRPFRGSLQERRRATAGTGGSPKQQNGSRRGGMRRRRRAQGRATHALGCRWTENGGRGRGGSSKHQAGSWSGGTRRRRRRAARATHPSWAAERGGGEDNRTRETAVEQRVRRRRRQTGYDSKAFGPTGESCLCYRKLPWLPPENDVVFLRVCCMWCFASFLCV